VVFYASPLLAGIGIPHAFSTRIGGISKPPFDSLNLGGTADSPDNIAENFRRLCQAAGCSGRTIRRTSQVHGSDSIWVNSNAPAAPLPSADAILTDDPRCISCVRTADCVPVLIASEDGRFVAAVHAGWRGVIKGVVPAAISALKAKAPNQNFLAAIGPSISALNFEVGYEVVVEFTNVFGDAVPIIRHPGKKPHIDLRHAIHLELRSAGLTPDHIDTTDRCTHRDANEFFSHRRDAGNTGRMAAIIACR
jgi:YfiH family protein